MVARRSFAPTFRDFSRSLSLAKRISEKNQKKFASSSSSIDRKSLHLGNESLFFSIFRDFEQFIEQIFVLHTMQVYDGSGVKATSFYSSRSYDRNRDLVKINSNVLDWNTPERVIERANAVLRDGYPISDQIRSNADILRRLKFIRNHIAHNSEESRLKFLNVVRHELGTLPISEPSAGEFLQMRTRVDRTKMYLELYFSELDRISNILAG